LIADLRLVFGDKANWQSGIQNPETTRYRVVVLTSCLREKRKIDS